MAMPYGLLEEMAEVLRTEERERRRAEQRARRR